MVYRLTRLSIAAATLGTAFWAHSAPAGAESRAAVAEISPITCAVKGNQGETTVIDWSPSDLGQPVEVRWFAEGKPEGHVVVIKALTGPDEQSLDPLRQKQILDMFEVKYTIGSDVQTILSGLPRNPPFDSKNEVRWRYQVQVLDAQGKVICGVDPDVCIRLPGGCNP